VAYQQLVTEAICAFQVPVLDLSEALPRVSDSLTWERHIFHVSGHELSKQGIPLEGPGPILADDLCGLDGPIHIARVDRIKRQFFELVRKEAGLYSSNFGERATKDFGDTLVLPMADQVHESLSTIAHSEDSDA